jgi:hypothetical protein
MGDAKHDDADRDQEDIGWSARAAAQDYVDAAARYMQVPLFS